MTSKHLTIRLATFSQRVKADWVTIRDHGFKEQDWNGNTYYVQEGKTTMKADLNPTRGQYQWAVKGWWIGRICSYDRKKYVITDVTCFPPGGKRRNVTITAIPCDQP